jgi:adenosylcobinamide-GDP ribazoletransferase
VSDVALDEAEPREASPLRDQLRVLLTGVMFLTRLPCPAWVGHDAAYLARSTSWFPTIGAFVGIAGSAVLLGAALAWPAWIAVALSTVMTVWLTGAFHEDALADACDGFGGGWGKDQILAIMKDSRVGSYGVVGLGLALAAKLGALTTIAGVSPEQAARALVAGHVLGRWSSLPLIMRLEYVRETGSKSKPFAASVTPARLVVGSLSAAALVWLALGTTRALVACMVAVVVTAIGGRYFRRVLGGITGDCLGAANQLVELATYLALASTWLLRA